ncbi:perosamine synthetase [Humibacillus xanthopallidus]|uniref:Perosamine synthetase n=1 Tax=Humibacillus xanthopallidus TaxID=412689 RepID=A0A543PPQ1_9MICO|nr:DegT/DnrJ/EryC1/StrS family aminotransferase [Humibacillus xanthopallidus]TQN46060.1 perosamine synthetase [Humibacillus xanthopallidus]
MTSETLTARPLTRSSVAPRPLPIPFARAVLTPEARAAANRVLESGWLTTGPEVADFEEELAAQVGARRGVAVSSCTAAIELVLRGMDLPAGAKVLMSADTFCGAAAAILHAGLVPVLADVDPATAMPGPREIRSAAVAAGGVDAMVVVHLGGSPTDVVAAADAAQVPLRRVVEDAAHALGASVAGRPVGTLSRATCFSFYATKNLAIGEGGMVTTDDDDLADVLLSTRLHGMSRDAWRRYLPGGSWRYDVRHEGLKANLTDVQAAVGRAQLVAFPRHQQRRAALAARYDARLSGLDGIRLPPRTALGTHAWHLYAVRVRPPFPINRDELIERLARRGIGTSVHFIPLHCLEWYAAHCVLPPGGLPGADEVYAETLSLPFDQHLTDDELDAVSAAIWQEGM